MIRLFYCPICRKTDKLGKNRKIVMLKTQIRYRPDDEGWVDEDVIRIRCPECNYMEYFSEEDDYDD